MLYKTKTYLLLLFVFSLSFEYWDPLGISSFFTITKFAGILYFIFSLFELRKNFDVSSAKRPLIVLFSLWLFLVIQNIINYWHGTTLSIYSFTFLQNIILFWLISNDLNRNSSLIKRLFLSLVFGVSLMAVLASFGVGISSEVDSEVGSYRLTFFGSNSNGVGNLAAVALLFITAMVLDKDAYFGNRTFLILLFVPNIITILSLSGSRGALIISLIGMIILIFLKRTSAFQKFITVIIGSACLAYAVSEVMESDIMRRRITLTTTENNLGGRDAIWKQALEIYYENPIIGVGITGYQEEMIKRYGTYMDTHNIFLYFMVSGGIIALFLYLIFLKEITGKAIKYYRHRKTALLLALLVVYLFSVFKSGGAINSKLNWLLIAIIFGLGTTNLSSYSFPKKTIK